MKRPFSALLVIAVLTAVLVAAGPVLAWPGGSHAQSLDLQEDFNYVGAAVKSMTDSTGHVVHYIDQGDEGWRTVVLIGGAGTGARAFELPEFVRDLREGNLGIRVICVERNGIGMTEFEPADADGNVIAADAGDAALALADPVKTREMYARDVLEVLDKEGVRKFSVIGISGGGPYTGELARQAGRRVRSIHLAVALCQSAPGWWVPRPGVPRHLQELHHQPDVVVGHDRHHRRPHPGLQEVAYEAAWSAFVRGQDADPHAVSMDYTVYKMTPPDVSMVSAPVFTYYGELDTTAGAAGPA